MRAVIAGKLYDSSAADLVWEWTDDTGGREALCLAPAGGWFLHADRGSAAAIQPLTTAAALAWCEQRGVDYFDPPSA